MQECEAFKALSETRRDILAFIKNAGGVTTAEVADRLAISDEGARQHLIHLEGRGWICREVQRPGPPRSGRPVVRYRITETGDHLFPKRYADLSIALMDALVDSYGREALGKLLSKIADRQAQVWEARLQGKSLRERLEALKGFYFEEDLFVEIEEDGGLILTEANCPYRTVALKYPELCSMTISTLMRLLGVGIERREKLQNGDGKCAFHLLLDRPASPDALRCSSKG